MIFLEDCVCPSNDIDQKNRDAGTGTLQQRQEVYQG